MSVLRFVRKPREKKQDPPKPEGIWPNDLPPPIYAQDNQNKAMAVSFLRGLSTCDGEPVYCSDISNDEARDLANWLRG